MKFRHPYDDDQKEIEREANKIYTTKPSKTQRHFAKDLDINEIARRFGLSDFSKLPNAKAASYYTLDFTEAPDFRTALDRIREARNRFDQLPAEIKNRFSNEPGILWDWIRDPRNADEAVKIGLLAKLEAEPEVKPPAPPQV